MPSPSWARLAAWNAYLLQAYGDDLVSAGSDSRYVTQGIFVFARGPYEQANIWLEQARTAQASDDSRFVFRLPHPLPHWHEPFRTDPQLAGMKATLGDTLAKALDGVSELGHLLAQPELIRTLA